MQQSITKGPLKSSYAFHTLRIFQCFLVFLHKSDIIRVGSLQYVGHNWNECWRVANGYNNGTIRFYVKTSLCDLNICCDNQLEMGVESWTFSNGNACIPRSRFEIMHTQQLRSIHYILPFVKVIKQHQSCWIRLRQELDAWRIVLKETSCGNRNLIISNVIAKDRWH